MSEADYGSLLKLENARLKKQIEEFQNTLLRVTGSIEVFSSGVPGSKYTLNEKIVEIINSATSELKIITPKIDPDYAKILLKKAETGTQIQIVINDRRLLTSEEQKKGAFGKLFSSGKSDDKEIEYDYAQVWDLLKAATGVDLINNPNVKFLMLLTPQEAVFSAGWLEKRILDKTVLLGVLIKDQNKIKELYEIYKLLLPSFMRK